MDRRYDGGSAYFQRADNYEEYGRQRDWDIRRGRENWENRIDRFLDTEERRPRDRSLRDDNSQDCDRGKERIRSSSRERRCERSRDEDRYDTSDRYKNWSEEEGRVKKHRERRKWEEGSPKERDYNQWNDSQNSCHIKDKMFKPVWGKQDGFDSSSSYNNDSLFGRNELAEFPPKQNETIMIRGLAQDITEKDLRQEIEKSGLNPKATRIIRRKDGTSRGFAFVEFSSTEQAVKLMAAKNGELMLNNHNRAIMQFSWPRQSRDNDWHCKCSAINFKRRNECYKCGCSRENALADEVSSYPTNTVLLRGLDTLTTESNVLESIQDQERKDVSIPNKMAVMSSNPISVPQKLDSLVAAYGTGSDSEVEEEETVEGEERQHVDWVKMACLLCMRKFPSKEVLLKHQQLSDLHKTNLDNWYSSRGLDPDDAQKQTLQYRDRAKKGD